MPLKAIIWDVGGVLVRTADRRPRTALASRLGTTYENLEHLVFNSPSGRAAQLGEITTAQNWENVRQQLGFSAAETPAVQAEFFGGDVLDRELVQFIRGLSARYTTAILSNMGDFLRPLLTDDWKIADAFAHIVISCEEGVMKPDPRIYQIVLARAGVAPHEAVFIDDFQHNIQGAQNAGLHGILFQNSEQVKEDVQKMSS